MLVGKSAKQVMKYTLMPEFMSRINALVLSGFQTIPYLIAVVYQMVRLLPANHPYLDGRNIGRYGIRHVIAEAANNLVISRKNIDQVILFIVILIGMVMIGLQLFLFGAAIFMQAAGAAPPPAWADNWNDLFVVPAGDRPHDIAYIMLDLVFGVPSPTAPGVDSFFGSCVGNPTPCLGSYGLASPVIDADFSHPDASEISAAVPAAQIGPLASGGWTVFPFPIHVGLHSLFAVYNLGIMVIALMIACYFIATVIAETAQSGTPFGKRFNKLWAPLRIVVAFGLLMPLPIFEKAVPPLILGYNSGQYIVLYAAKWGSAFATNGWNRFNTTLLDSIDPADEGGVMLNGGSRLPISKPNTPNLEELALFMWVANVCDHIAEYINDPPTNMRGYIIGRQDRAPNNTLPLLDSSYADVINWLDPNPKMITIRFGEKNEQLYPKEDGFVKPMCGEIQIPLTDGSKLVPTPPMLPAKPGPYLMQNFYYELVRQMWIEDSTPVASITVGPVTLPMPNVYLLADIATGQPGFMQRAEGFAWQQLNPGATLPATYAKLDVNYITSVNQIITDATDIAIDFAVEAQLGDPATWDLGPCQGPGGPLAQKGWGAAGIWYNCIADMNGSMTSSALSVPVYTKWPDVMERVAALKSRYNNKTAKSNMFQPTVAGIKDTALQQALGDDTKYAQILYKAYTQWALSEKADDNNDVTDMIHMFLGTSGLYSMRENPDVHPLAQLVGIGRALVEAAIRKLGYAMVSAFASRFLDGADNGLLSVTSSMLVTFAMLGLTAGFLLYYIVPFLPFIYFFFALGGWVKGIFEAMVGTPLWALAHIRIDGHGLPGSAALNGYFLIFEIFIRPILTLFGLLASISIFAALVTGLNKIFDLVVYNAAGFDMQSELTGAAAESVMKSMRGSIDEFFFTIIYAVIVYMMAMSSFKLIDQIPNNILRWMGQSVSTFGDTREDPAQGLMSKASIGAQQTFSKLGTGMQGIVGAIGKTK